MTNNHRRSENIEQPNPAQDAPQMMTCPHCGFQTIDNYTMEQHGAVNHKIPSSQNAQDGLFALHTRVPGFGTIEAIRTTQGQRDYLLRDSKGIVTWLDQSAIAKILNPAPVLNELLHLNPGTYDNEDDEIERKNV